MRCLLLFPVVLVACAAPSGVVPDAGPAGDGGFLPDPKSYDCSGMALPAVKAKPDPCLVDRACRTRLVAGHRGAGGALGALAPEDTLAAYRAAIVLGIDYVETDPRPTKDGVMINLHDTTVDRTTTGTGAAADLTLAEIQALPLRLDKYTGDFGCERIPTLRALLELCRGRVMVLIDANKTDRVDLLVKDVKDANALDWAIFDTSSVAKIDEALLLEPNLLTMIRVASVADLDAQLTHFAAHPPIIVEVDRNADTKDVAAAVHAKGHRPFTDVFIEDLSVALEGNLRAYDKSWALGVDIAQTDRPAEMLRYLKRR
ncbi:MAG: glycerophosphodiester phosphodiesterase family protein [Myxococcaceae bacterium]|nr:glycerophosphodiester phosphodiesterase family protein [Myxococcaceae bacterium]